jgi:HEAT repeat protein
LVDQEKIHNQCLSDDPKERINALGELKYNFSSISNKQQAWNDLLRLTNDDDRDVRSSAAFALSSAFPYLPDTQFAWNYLLRLTNDKDRYVRSNAASTLVSAFFYVPDKQQAWNDLVRLTDNEDSGVRSNATFELSSVFSQVPDKQQAWNDLVRLTDNEDSDVRFNAAFDLSFAFSQVPDKQQAWNDLHRLTNNEDIDVRYETAKTLGSVSSHILDKQQAWNDLHRLTNDVSSYVRSSSYHSLGRFSIFMASQAETDEDYKKELEKAIEFFEKAAQESKEWINPSKFCLPFYRSFHSIIFKKQEAREEVNKYLVEAKSAIEGSESKKQLFEAVENLAEALKDVQSLGNLDLEAIKSELNFYRKYCDRAAELMRDTEETAPFATITLRKGLPILDRNLKELIEEIQKKAKIACKESKGTEAEEIVCEINNEIQDAVIDYQMQYLETTKILEDILSIVKMKIPQIPENKFILSKIEAVDNRIISADKYHDLPLIISLMSTIKAISAEQELDQIKHKIEYISDKSDLIYDNAIRISAKLDEISFSIFRIKLNSHNVISNLEAMKIELEKLSEFAKLNGSFLGKLNPTQAKDLNDVNNNIQDRLDDLASLIDDLPKSNVIKEILEKLNELRQSDLDILLQRSSGISSLISFFVMFAQLY